VHIPGELGCVDIELTGRGTTWVRIGGHGTRPVVLLHGWTATADLNWGTSYPALAARYHVIAPDLRGHGRGLRTRQPFDLETVAADVAALLDLLAPGPVLVAGYSMGGAVAQLLWRERPDLVDGLVLCATAATFNGTSRERTLFGVLNGLSVVAPAFPARVRSTAALRIMAGRTGRSVGVLGRSDLARHDWVQVARAGRSLGRHDARPWIGRIDRPTAVVATIRDEVVPPHRQLDLAGRIHGATVHPVAGGHSVVLNGPERFVPQLLAALASVEQRSGPRRGLAPVAR